MFSGEKNSAALGACLVLAVLAFARPAAAAAGASAGLSLCAHSLIPAVFPLLTLSQVLLTSRAASAFALPFRPYLRALGVRERHAASAVALGWLGGFACGAQSIGALRSEGVLSRRDAQILLCCTICSGPAFVVSAVGTLMLRSTAAGWVLLASLLLANLVTGLAMRLLLPVKAADNDPAAAQNTPSGFVYAVQRSALSMLSLCGFVVFFAFALGAALPEDASASVRWCAAAFLEVTNACGTAAQSSSSLRFYLCCASLSMMGASVFLQVRSLVPRDVSLLPLLFSRLIHLPLSLLISRVLLCLFPSAAAAGAPARLWMPLDAATAVFLMLCVTLVPRRSLRTGENGV